MPILSTDQMTQIATALGLSVNPYAGAQPLVMDQDFKNPRATQLGIGGEREIFTGMTVGAEFLYVKTDYLQRNREVNLGHPGPERRRGAAPDLCHAASGRRIWARSRCASRPPSPSTAPSPSPARRASRGAS